MPNLFHVGGYWVYFWSNENIEPIHVHVSEGRPMENATKIWLTSKGGCILANNNSKIPQSKLKDIMDVVEAQFFYICRRWQEHMKTEDIHFYC